MREVFTCPDCGLTSHNPTDVLEQYCGNCHDWTGDRASTTTQYVTRCRDGWARIIDGNKGLGWPDHALCIFQPASFVRQLDKLLRMLSSEGSYVGRHRRE